MSLEPDSVIEESLSHEERAVVALEAIADALALWAKLEAQRFEKEYPERKPPADAKITKLKSEEDELRESLGDDGSETLEEWTDLGPRERELLKKSGG